MICVKTLEQMQRKKQLASKHLARAKYKERKIDTYIKWTVNKRGYLKWKDLIEIHNKYNIKCYG
jgi:hypothetical protein